MRPFIPLVLGFALTLLPQYTAAQPSTDIHLADVRIRDGVLHLATPRNVTQRDGYDNQPWFLPDGSAFLYSSGRDGQTDIFRFDVHRGVSERVTDTPENEYSPSLPGDGSRMMVVRWPTDMSTGALWWFTPDGSPLEEARGSVPRVGYYAFADDTTLALFINDSVQSFMLSDTRTGESVRIGEAMNGSAPRRIPGQHAVSFQQRDDDGAWWLTRLDVADRRTTPLVRMIGNVPNYTWTPHGSVLAAVRNTVYEWRPGSDEWRVVAEFSDPALQDITRIAITPQGDRLALVSAR
jgi:Tol biopolymer transport system component